MFVPFIDSQQCALVIASPGNVFIGVDLNNFPDSYTECPGGTYSSGLFVLGRQAGRKSWRVFKYPNDLIAPTVGDFD
jgi:hypothetical protein